jgi:hypothetical protein
MGGEDVAHAGSDAAVHDRGDLVLSGEGVQLERVLGEEGDIDDGLPGLEDGLERRARAWALISTTVTLKSASLARSRAIGPPTRPEPNTTIFFMMPPWGRNNGEPLEFVGWTGPDYSPLKRLT